MKPKLFIASSVEQLDLAYAVQESLEHSLECTVWDQGVFSLSRTTMGSLIDVLDRIDFGVFVFAPDDVSVIREAAKQTVRDNVIFELGLFAGRLGIERCFIIIPRGMDDLRIPTDLLGLTPAVYDPEREDKNLTAALGPACNKIRKATAMIGPLRAEKSSLVLVDPPESSELIGGAADCKILIQSWMGNRQPQQNQSAIKFSDVDRELGLVAGSTKKYIEEVALKYSYVVAHRGEQLIKFEKRRT